MKTMNYFAVVRALTGMDGTVGAGTGMDGNVDISSMDRDSAKAFLRVLGEARSVIASLEIETAARLTDIGGEYLAERHLQVDARVSPGQARVIMKRVDAVASMPMFADALEDAKVTPEHVDVVARGLKKLGDKRDLLTGHQGRLVSEASYMSVPRFSRLVENLAASLDQKSENDRFTHQQRQTQVKLWEDHKTGMIRITGEFDPERGSRLWTILDGAVELMFHGSQKNGPVNGLEPASGVDPNDHRRGIALCDLVQAGAHESILNGISGLTAACICEETDGEPPVTSNDSRLRTQVIVTVDLDTLRNGVHESSVRRDGNGLDLPVDVIRRMACDAGIIPMVLNPDGVVVDVGRSKRLATRRQRLAIFAMHDTCAAPHCGVRVKQCVPHHIDWWERGGRTDLVNLVPLCSRHHHLVHEGGWTLSMDTARRVTMAPPPEVGEAV